VALAGLKKALFGGAPDDLVNLQEVDKFLTQLGVGGSKQLLGNEQTIHQGELLSLMAHGNPNIDQPLQVIKNLVAFGKAGNAYDLMAANTAMHGIRDLNADPVQIGSAMESQVHRADFIAHQLGQPRRTSGQSSQFQIAQPDKAMPIGDRLQSYADTHWRGDKAKATEYLKSKGYQ
jgi:hypothetical protein